MRRIIAALLTLSAALPAGAAEPVAVKVRAMEVGGKGRILLDPAEELSHQARVDGANLILRFDKPVQADPADILRPLGGYFAGVTQDANGQTFTFGLRQPLSVRTYQSSGPIVIDLVPGNPPPPVRANESAGAAETSNPFTAPAAQAARAPVAATATPRGPEVVKVRAGTHRGFTRLVFDWKRPVEYQGVERDGTFKLEFNRPARLDISEVSPERAVFVQPSEAAP